MALRTHHRRAGMTLVELLVVVAIIGLLAVTVLPNVASTTESRRSREAARVASTFVARAQARAIGRPEWAGVTVVPPNATALYAIDMFQANVPQVYRGETFLSKAGVAGTNRLTRQLQFFEGSGAGSIPAARNVADSDLIRLDGNGPWYELAVTGTPPAATYGLRLRGSVGGSASATEMATQTSQNTPWPTAYPDTHSFEILRQPVRNGSVFTIPDGRCIDLTWSGFGSPAVFTSKRFNSPGVSITLLFDSTGRVRQLFYPAWSPARVTVTGPVYFLVGRVDRATNDPTLASTFDGKDDTKGFNWQYGDSYWIGIDPASGIVKTAECLPGQADVVASQALIRSEMPAGGR